MSTLLLVWLLLSLAQGVRAQSAGAERPNIVFILADDLGYGDLGCCGHPIIRTPVLDRMAAEGVRFTQFYVTSPVCSPTRASFMTGRQPQRFGIHHADLPEGEPRYFLPLSAVTLSERLREAGYGTAHIGKWHLGEPPFTGPPREHGFDFFFGGLGGRPSSSWMKFARSNNAQFFRNEETAQTYPGQVTDITTDEAIASIDRAVGGGKPFFLNLWYNAPHEPLTPEVEEKAYYDSIEGLDERERVYYGTVANLDKNIGRVLAKLDELGIAKNTLVFFTSDNGPETHGGPSSAGSAKPLRGIKTQLWEGGIRVPAIARMPGTLPGGATSEAIGCSLDFFPTVCEAAGVACDDASLELEGSSQWKVWKGEAEAIDRPLFFEFHAPQRGGLGQPNEMGSAPSGTLVVRMGDWKLHLFPGLADRMLYDLKKDQGETTDLVDRFPEEADRLEQVALAWYAELPKQCNLFRLPRPIPENEAEANHWRWSAGEGSE